MTFTKIAAASALALLMAAPALAQPPRMTPEERAAMMEAQRQSYARGEMHWPKPKFKYVNGVLDKLALKLRPVEVEARQRGR